MLRTRFIALAISSLLLFNVSNLSAGNLPLSSNQILEYQSGISEKFSSSYLEKAEIISLNNNLVLLNTSKIEKITFKGFLGIETTGYVLTPVAHLSTGCNSIFLPGHGTWEENGGTSVVQQLLNKGCKVGIVLMPPGGFKNSESLGKFSDKSQNTILSKVLDKDLTKFKLHDWGYKVAASIGGPKTYSLFSYPVIKMMNRLNISSKNRDRNLIIGHSGGALTAMVVAGMKPYFSNVFLVSGVSASHTRFGYMDWEQQYDLFTKERIKDFYKEILSAQGSRLVESFNVFDTCCFNFDESPFRQEFSRIAATHNSKFVSLINWDPTIGHNIPGRINDLIKDLDLDPNREITQKLISNIRSEAIFTSTPKTLLGVSKESLNKWFQTTKPYNQQIDEFPKIIYPKSKTQLQNFWSNSSKVLEQKGSVLLLSEDTPVTKVNGVSYLALTSQILAKKPKLLIDGQASINTKCQALYRSGVQILNLGANGEYLSETPIVDISVIKSFSLVIDYDRNTPNFAIRIFTEGLDCIGKIALTNLEIRAP